MGEIITLQFGNYANYVGSHYWNIQERNYDYCQENNKEHEIEADILWRGGEINGAVKYTPRAIVVDLKDSKGSLSREGRTLRDRPQPQITSWEGGATTTVSDTRSAPAFDDFSSQAAAKGVEYWSDYLTMDLHPQSIFEMRNYKFGIDEFDKYSDGQDFMQDIQEVEDVVNNVRKFLEEANSPQGFQIFANINDGFSAVAAGILENINDEFDKPSLTFGLTPYPPTTERDVFNTAMGTTSLFKASALYVPVVMDWSYYQARLHLEETLYCSSAAIAASLDTATLNFRSFYRTLEFHGALQTLRPESSMNVASLSSSFPFPFEPARIQEAFFTPLPPSHFHSSAPPDVPSSPPDVTSFLHPLLPKFKRDENLEYLEVYEELNSKAEGYAPMNDDD